MLSPTGSHVGSFNLKNSASFGYNSPSIGPDGTVYISGSDGYVYALNPSIKGNPTIKWSQYTYYKASSVAVASDGTLWYGTDNGYIYNDYPSGKQRGYFSGDYGGQARHPSQPTARCTLYQETSWQRSMFRPTQSCLLNQSSTSKHFSN